MAPERLSRLQRRILAWLAAEDQRTRGTMRASHEDLVRALGHLSEKQRAAFVLYHYAGYPHAEVARIIGSTTAAVAVHLHRARGRLRDLLREGRDDG